MTLTLSRHQRVATGLALVGALALAGCAATVAVEAQLSNSSSSSSSSTAGAAGGIDPAVQAQIDAAVSAALGDTVAQLADLTTAVDTSWLLVTSFLVFFMQAGFALLEAGAVGSKDIISILLKNFTDFAISTCVYWMLGEGWQSGFTAFIGASEAKQFSIDTLADMSALMNKSVFCATAVTIVSGAIACRFSFHAYMVMCVCFSGFIYPIAAGWVWGHGFLGLDHLQAIDFAGSGVVHLQGACIAITGAIFVGPRLGRFVVDPNNPKKVVPSTDFGGNSIVLTALGTLILWFGWYGFNVSTPKQHTYTHMQRETAGTKPGASQLEVGSLC